MSNKKIYGLIGFPVKHSLSKIMHNSAFSFLNINAEYRLFEIRPQELEDFLLNPNKIVFDTEGNKVYSKDIVGFNVTIPHKIMVKEILEKNSLILNLKDLKDLNIVGAINTVSRLNNNKFNCYNTDIYGFSVSLKKDLKFNIKKDTEVFILGCGGAARAVIYSLCYGKGVCPKKIYIFDINQNAFLNFIEYLRKINENKIYKTIEFVSKKDSQFILKRCRLFVNASPIGMKDDRRMFIKKSFLHNRLKIFDLVYNRETKLIKYSKSLGLKFTDGKNMLLYQAAKAFEIWTKKRAPVNIMRKALEDAFN